MSAAAGRRPPRRGARTASLLAVPQQALLAQQSAESPSPSSVTNCHQWLIRRRQGCTGVASSSQHAIHAEFYPKHACGHGKKPPSLCRLPCSALQSAAQRTCLALPCLPCGQQASGAWAAAALHHGRPSSPLTPWACSAKKDAERGLGLWQGGAGLGLGGWTHGSPPRRAALMLVWLLSGLMRVGLVQVGCRARVAGRRWQRRGGGGNKECEAAAKAGRAALMVQVVQITRFRPYSQRHSFAPCAAHAAQLVASWQASIRGGRCFSQPGLPERR